MYQRTGKPSVAKFRCRLQAIHDASASGLEMAEHWNPKGRYFKTRRDMIAFFKANKEASTVILEYLKKGNGRG